MKVRGMSQVAKKHTFLIFQTVFGGMVERGDFAVNDVQRRQRVVEHHESLPGLHHLLTATEVVVNVFSTGIWSHCNSVHVFMQYP